MKIRQARKICKNIITRGAWDNKEEFFCILIPTINVGRQLGFGRSGYWSIGISWLFWQFNIYINR